MWIFLNPQLFLSGYNFLLLASGEFGNQSGIFFKISLPDWKKIYPPITCGRVNPDIFESNMAAQRVRPVSVEWIRIPSDACRRANSILIRCVWTEKCLNPERKSFGFTNIQIRGDGALEYAQYYLLHFSITERLYTFATRPIYMGYWPSVRSRWSTWKTKHPRERILLNLIRPVWKFVLYNWKLPVIFTMKLQNVLMDEEGSLKTFDFSLVMNSMWVAQKFREDGETGTPLYLTPEVRLMSSPQNKHFIQ